MANKASRRIATKIGCKLCIFPKQAKYIMRIALVESFTHIAGGKGGFWEDEGCTWYAGI